MKKLLSVILVLGMLLSALCITAGAEGGAELSQTEISELKLRRADANADGYYSVADVQALLKAAAGTAEDKDEYDVNMDGTTSVEDALAVLREISGIEPILSSDETVALFNAKVNGVKVRGTGLPGFTKTTTATCNSMKITQEVSATGLAVLVSGNMACKDLEFDKYVDKMVSMMESTGNLTQADKDNIAAMRQSAEEYKKPQTETEVAEKGDYVDHFLCFPRNAKNTASEITTADISTVAYSMSAGNIVYTIKLPNKKYTSYATYEANTYAKVMNVVDLDDSDGSTLKSMELKNGTIVVTTDAATGAMKNANYSYSYYSEIAAPVQQQSDSTYGSITIKLTTKTSATISESVVF